ncbi:MAG: UvrD-helicase domain-containing protein [Planctomycetota bacterium]
MTAPLTPAQRRAVERPRGDACVLAGAGCGKTTVLTQRFVELVARHGLDPRRVAALTFTDQAAGEMRARIVAAFRADPALRAKADDVEFAPVTTIHAFGARLLREHAVAAGVDPAFALLDETEARLLLEDAWTRVERRLRRADAPALRTLRRAGGEGAAALLLGLHARLRGLGMDPAAVTVAPAARTVADVLADVEAALARLDDAVAAAGLGAAHAAAFAGARARLASPAELRRGGFEAVRRAQEAARGARAKNAVLPLPPKVAKDERDAVFAAYDAAGALLDAWAAAELDGPVRELVGALDAAYERAKHERSVLDFADLEVRTERLLARLASRGLPLPGAPAALLVDEYQDVNPVQARILARLRASPAGRRADQFSVGDPKQSIYRFRRADVAVMTEAWEGVGAAGRERLATSFRARAELVAFHNAAFSTWFGPAEAGRIGYDPLDAGATFLASVPPTPPELLVVDAGDAGVSPDVAEARAVAARIRALVDGRAPLAKVPRGGDAAAPRAVRWGDVAILLRSRTHLKAFERALLEAGVPFHVGKGAGFYRAAEIEDLLHLLRAVHDPLDRYALAAFLASPAVGAGDADLLALFARGADPAAEAAARPALADAFERLARLRRVAASGSLETVARTAVEGFDLATTALLQPGGPRRARNLAKAVALARRLDDEGRHGLYDLLRLLSDLRDREVREAEAESGLEGDAVAILTVHAAKGLEWPVVFAADAGRGPARQVDDVLLDAHGRVGWRVLDPLEGTVAATGAHARLGAAEKAADDAESLRLRYVAWTRAEERLVVSAAVRGATKTGRPMRLAGDAAALWDLVGAKFEPGTRVLAAGGVPVRVTVERPLPAPAGATGPFFAQRGPAAVLGDPALAPTPEELAAATGDWARVAASPPGLGRTPFVASISELVAFAGSPAAYYREHLVGADDREEDRAVAAERDDPAAGREAAPDPEARRAARRARHDEGHDVVAGVDRAALGRAVHLAIERFAPDGDLDGLVAGALAEELPDATPAAAALARAMVERFLASDAGRATRAAVAAGRGVRREAAFHARVRFPDGEPVAGFSALLVKGTVDLWLDGDDGRPRLYDHKTNAPGAALPDAAALLDRYATQLRLYALATERIVERDVASASLLLLDPAWAARGVPVEVAVDVSGEALAATRRLCRAYAVAMLEQRFPARWEDLLR